MLVHQRVIFRCCAHASSLHHLHLIPSEGLCSVQLHPERGLGPVRRAARWHVPGRHAAAAAEDVHPQPGLRRGHAQEVQDFFADRGGPLQGESQPTADWAPTVWQLWGIKGRFFFQLCHNFGGSERPILF